MSEASVSAGTSATGTAASGTLRVFRRLRRRELEVIPHGFHGFPLVDVYELQSFRAVVSSDGVSHATDLQFYVYHQSDGVASVRGEDGTVEQVRVDHSADPFHIPFEDALRMAGVQYDGERHLGDLVVAFWDALFAPPSELFDETSFGASPWLDRDEGDRRTLGSVSPGEGGELNNLRFRFRPRKTLNWPGPAGVGGSGEPGLQILMDAVHTWLVKKEEGTAKGMALALYERLHGPVVIENGGVTAGAVGAGAPPGVEVLQLDLDRVGVRLLGDGPDAEVPVMVLLRS
jgi:hypothetical protein